MKKTVLIGLMIMCIQNMLLAQSGNAEMHIHTSTNGIDIYPLADIDSITFLLVEASETVTDIDGNVYQTVKIGDQIWMAENLKVTRYRNGDIIPNVTDNTEWSNLSTGAWCAYGNEPSYTDTYGLLYNWYVVDDSRNIAPEGWHVPTDEEWKELEMYLGMSKNQADSIGWRGTDEGGELKEMGTTHWNSPNTGATNASGFTALPGGYRADKSTFYTEGRYGAWWTSTEISSSNAWFRELDSNTSNIHRNYFSEYYKRFGFSVRCVKDQ